MSLLLESLRLPDHKRGTLPIAQCQSIRFDLPYAQLWNLRLPTYHAGEDSNFCHISCEDLEAASLTIMESARVRRQERDKSVPFRQLQAATVPAQAGQLAFAPATVRPDTSRPVAVGLAGEQLHNRLQVSSTTSHTFWGELHCIFQPLYQIVTAIASNCESRQLLLHLQSRPQSASVHKRKGWHALQHGGPQQPSPTTRTGNTNSAVYVRPDRSVNATIPLGSSPSFPSLGSVADALPIYNRYSCH